MAKARVGTHRLRSSLITAFVIAPTAALTIVAQADFNAPPRYDGAGYTVLARSLRQGTGYRAIDHPDHPRHAHFPPGYPLALAALEVVAGPSSLSAHVFSTACAVGATLAAWQWYRRTYPRDVAGLLGLAVAVNWAWSRTGSAIQSEPLYQLLGQLAILAVPATLRHGQRRTWVLPLGALLAACLLTRQIAIGLVLTILVHVGLRWGWRTALATLALVSAAVSPWLVWLAVAGGQQRTQAELLLSAGSDVLGRIRAQGLFYLSRIPDQICGPLVEYATVVRQGGGWKTIAWLWAAIATAVVLLGWFSTLRRPRRRLAGMISLATLAILLIWPYTEAGRFLIPLIPCLLIGAYEGLRGMLAFMTRLTGSDRLGRRRTRLIAAIVLLAVSLPYTGYSILLRRARPEDASNRAFDAACAWLREHGDRPGPVLTRHPGEVFLSAGREALEVSSSERPGDRDAEPEAVAAVIKRYGVAYLLIDDDRYLQAAPSSLSRFVRAHPERVKRVGAWEAERSRVELYEAAPAR